MVQPLIKDQSVNETKAAPTLPISPRKFLQLSLADGSPLTDQDQIVLAVLGELKLQGYKFRVVNMTLAGVKQAAILLPTRLWVFDEQVNSTGNPASTAAG